MRDPGMLEPEMRDPGMRDPGIRDPGMRDPGMPEQAGLLSLPGPAHGAAVPALPGWKSEIRISDGQGIVLSSGFPWRFIKNEMLRYSGLVWTDQTIGALSFSSLFQGGKKKINLWIAKHDSSQEGQESCEHHPGVNHRHSSRWDFLIPVFLLFFPSSGSLLQPGASPRR